MIHNQFQFFWSKHFGPHFKNRNWTTKMIWISIKLEMNLIKIRKKKFKYGFGIKVNRNVNDKMRIYIFHICECHTLYGDHIHLGSLCDQSSSTISLRFSLLVNIFFSVAIILVSKSNLLDLLLSEKWTREQTEVKKAKNGIESNHLIIFISLDCGLTFS